MVARDYMTENYPDRLHLRRLENTKRQPLIFITICALNRNECLILPAVYSAIEECLKKSESMYGWETGKFVVMPDHIHFFCRPKEESVSLSVFVGRFKSWTQKAAKESGCCARLWHKEFFDHILRNRESYSKKWEYVQMNPVRAGLCRKPEEWKYQGEISRIEIR